MPMPTCLPRGKVETRNADVVLVRATKRVTLRSEGFVLSGWLWHSVASVQSGRPTHRPVACH
jgi:hypothetical protein